jgi:hypothetical protein
MSSKINFEEITRVFVNFYYENWMKNCPNLFSSCLWKHFTKMKVDNVELGITDIKSWHENFKDASFELIRYQYVLDGTRRIELMVQGKISKNNLTKIINQNFSLLEHSGQWWIKSILIFFND